MTRAMGYAAAKAYADRHELKAMNSRRLYLGLPECEHSEMDLYNNEMGRRIAVREKACGDPAALAQAVLRYANSPKAYFRFVSKEETKTLAQARPEGFDEVFSALGLSKATENTPSQSNISAL